MCMYDNSDVLTGMVRVVVRRRRRKQQLRFGEQLGRRRRVYAEVFAFF